MIYTTQFNFGDTVRDTGRATKPFTITEIRIINWTDPDDKKTRCYAEYRSVTRVDGRLKRTPWVAEKYLELVVQG